jgi:hypothetical protein
MAGLALVTLLFVIMASAWQRLSIYMDALGLTELRFYAAVVLIWLAFAFVWFSICQLGAARNLFLSGVSLAAVLVLITVNLVNPDGLIAQTNTSRLKSGRSFDADYVANLSADAVPTLLRRLDRVNTNDRCVLAQRLMADWLVADNDWRSLNLGRYRAQRIVRENRDVLEIACR